ncbi:MAG: hypothetical protein ACLVLH_23880 [Eisenbergiella massiliensis]
MAATRLTPAVVASLVSIMQPTMQVTRGFGDGIDLGSTERPSAFHEFDVRDIGTAVFAGGRHRGGCGWIRQHDADAAYCCGHRRNLQNPSGRHCSTASMPAFKFWMA